MSCGVTLLLKMGLNDIYHSVKICCQCSWFCLGFGLLIQGPK